MPTALVPCARGPRAHGPCTVRTGPRAHRAFSPCTRGLRFLALKRWDVGGLGSFPPSRPLHAPDRLQAAAVASLSPVLLRAPWDFAAPWRSSGMGSSSGISLPLFFFFLLWIRFSLGFPPLLV